MSDKNFDYIQDTQTLVGQQRRELMDTKTGELMHVDQITKRVYGFIDQRCIDKITLGCMETGL